jgi:hypothetical protein
MKNWKVLDRFQEEDELTLEVGADDPAALEWEETLNQVAAHAKRMGYPILKGMSEIRTFGQNELARRSFRYMKEPKLEEVTEYIDDCDKDDMLMREYPRRKRK